jgi:Na+/pantothenate symporter
LIATILAQWKTNIYELVAGASILLMVSLLVPLTAGLYWKKASEMGALMSIVFGMIAYLVLEMFELPIYTHIPALCISAAAMIVGTLIFPKKQLHAPISHHQTP